MDGKKKYQILGKDIEESSLSQARFNAPSYLPSVKAQEVIKNTWSRWTEIRNNRDLNYKWFGKTRDGIYSGKAPACLNGQIIANAEGYARGKAGFSTNSESLAEIILDKEYEVELEIEANGKPIEGNALVVF